jgi:hypothetical protein
MVVPPSPSVGRGARRALSALVPAFALALAAGDAQAYCRATTCKGTDACDGEEIQGCAPLQWKRDCIGFALQEDGSQEVLFDRVREVVDTSFAVWWQADCVGAPPGIVVQNMGTVSCGEVEFNSTAGNANVLVFRDDVWPHEDGQHNLALTTVSFDPTTGELYNADIEVNTAGYDFIDGGDYDLQSVLTHEVGHFLGLSHSPLETATMYYAYSNGSTEFRDLSEDDVFGMCSIYPPADVDPLRCNPIPRHGFSSVCGSEQTSGCGVSPAGSGAAGALAAAIGAAAALVAARARRKASRRGAPERA